MACRATDGLFDLLGRLRGFLAVVDAHVDRAVALAAQTRHQSGTQNRSLAQTRLTEQHREQLALHPASEFGDLFVPPKEEGTGLLRERGQSQPRIALIDRGNR